MRLTDLKAIEASQRLSQLRDKRRLYENEKRDQPFWYSVVAVCIAIIIILSVFAEEIDEVIKQVR